jgi:hypothetical protein
VDGAGALLPWLVAGCASATVGRVMSLALFNSFCFWTFRVGLLRAGLRGGDTRRGRAPGRPPFMIASFDAVSFFISPIIAVMFSCIFIICWSRTSSFWSICVFINVASCCMTAGFKPPSPDDIVVVW